MILSNGPVPFSEARANLIVVDEWGSMAWRWSPHRRACYFDGKGLKIRWMHGPGTPSAFVFSAARMSWYINTGHWPTRRLRFLNGNPANISFANLVLPGEPYVGDLV